MKPVVVKKAEKLRDAYKQMRIDGKFPRDFDLYFQFGRTLGEPNDIIFIDEDNFFLEEVTGHELPFYLGSNHLDPENPVTPKQAVQKLLEAMADAQPDPEDPDTMIIKSEGVFPETYIGKYVSSLDEAVECVRLWKTLPVKDWPKEYNKPVQL